MVGIVLILILMSILVMLILKYQEKNKHLSNALHSLKKELSSSVVHLTQEKQKIETLLNSMYDGFVAIDSEKKVLLYNERFLENLNLKNTLISGQKIYELIRIPEILDSLEKSLSDKKTIQKLIPILDVTEKYFEMIVSPIYFQDKTVTGAVAIFHDVTEHKSLENMRVDFVANVSHEFKTPLTSIKGYADTLLMDPRFRGDETTGSFIQVIKNNSERLIDLVNDLLTLSHLETQDPLHKEIILNEPFLQKIIQSFEPLATSKNIILKTSIHYPHIFADEKKLELAVRNLLDNAIKYTPEGGKVWIEVSEGKIVVEDSGIGIPSSHLPRIFERFYRVDSGRSRDMGGTGLGLAIVKHVAILHEGNISVESQPNLGSKFTLTLPS